MRPINLKAQAVMDRLLKQAKTILSLVRKFGVCKMLIAHKEGLDDSNFVLTSCPNCGTDKRVHKMGAARGMIKCTNCKTWFVVTNQTTEENAFMQAFGGKGR